jgi:hypothetical protein
MSEAAKASWGAGARKAGWRWTSVETTALVVRSVLRNE